jgi:thioredoxin-related protein
MRVSPARLTLILPIVTAAILTIPRTAPAADPVVWRIDYATARKEAVERGLPLLVVVGTDNCYYCKKLEAGPCREPAVAAQLTKQFIPLKVDATRDPQLARALKVQVYPTIVLAGPDGKIHAFVEGYIESDRLLEHMKRTTANVAAAADWAARDFDLANKALASGEYQRVVSLLKVIVREVGDKPIGAKSQQILEEVERLAATRLAKARDLDQRGYTQEAIEYLTETLKTFAGTQAAADAATMIAGMSVKPDVPEKIRLKTARDLLAVARDDFRAGRFHDCLQRCEQLVLFTDIPESKEGASLAAEVKGNPERLAVACEQMNQRTAAMYMTLAEAWMNKGQIPDAIACYEKVARLSPNSRTGDTALAQLAKLKACGGTTPVNLSKPNQ